jgi:hypothetical protein
MSNKTLISLFLVVSSMLISCKKELEPQESSSSIAPAVQTNSPAAINTMPSSMQQNSTGSNPAMPAKTISATIAEGMNPPHGQPNHRCDISVGAPLNAPPGNTTAAPSKSAPASATEVPKTTYTTSESPAVLNNTPTKTAQGMNPPHGQEGHRCEVAVGAALPK